MTDSSSTPESIDTAARESARSLSPSPRPHVGDTEATEPDTPAAEASSGIVKAEKNEPELTPGHVGPSGKYSFSDDQAKLLSAKMPRYLAAATRKRKKVAREIYDELSKLPIFGLPEGKTKQTWKSTVIRWFENHHKKKDDTPRGARKASRSDSPNVRPTADGDVTREESPVRVKALTKLFNRLVNGTLTVKTGREVFGEAHPELLERTMSENNESDPEKVLSELWDATNSQTKE
ncbi:hypothetical protein V5O48_019316, partial [Marasmius crinis-equi]